MIDLNKEYGLVFGGGGAKGSFQMGAWKAFDELGVKFKGVVGTSIGALNGAMFVQGDYEKALELWETMSYKSVLDVEDETVIDNIMKLNYKELTLDDVVNSMTKLTKKGGFETAGIRRLIDDNIDEQRIKNSDLDFGLVTYSVTDIKPLELYKEDIMDGELPGYLMATSYLPVFKIEKINGKYFLDGGFHSVAPAELLVKKGYKDIIIVKLDAPGIERKVSDKGVNVITIEPREDIGRVVEFSAEQAKYNIQLGYYETMKVLCDLQGEHYYISVKRSERYYANRLLKIRKTTLKKMVKGRYYAEYSLQRYLMEQALPHIARKLKLDTYWTYEELIITILEIVAKMIALERFKIYTYDEFLAEIKKQLPKYEALIQYDTKSTDMYHIFSDIIKVL